MQRWQQRRRPCPNTNRGGVAVSLDTHGAQGEAVEVRFGQRDREPSAGNRPARAAAGCGPDRRARRGARRRQRMYAALSSVSASLSPAPKAAAAPRSGRSRARGQPRVPRWATWGHAGQGGGVSGRNGFARRISGPADMRAHDATMGMAARHIVKTWEIAAISAGGPCRGRPRARPGHVRAPRRASLSCEK